MLQKPVRITKHGNATVVSIPRPVLFACGLQIGDLVICELTEARTFQYRLATARDLQPERMRPFLTPESVDAK